MFYYLYSEVRDTNAQVKGRVPFIDSEKTIQEQRTAQKRGITLTAERLRKVTVVECNVSTTCENTSTPMSVVTGGVT